MLSDDKENKDGLAGSARGMAEDCMRTERV